MFRILIETFFYSFKKFTNYLMFGKRSIFGSVKNINVGELQIVDKFIIAIFIIFSIFRIIKASEKKYLGTKKHIFRITGHIIFWILLITFFKKIRS